jgi:hypothetical protein
MVWQLGNYTAGLTAKDYIAAYAALVSTITAFWQVRNAVHDRANLSIMLENVGRTLIAKVTNVGRRPVTVDRLVVGCRPQDGRDMYFYAVPQGMVETKSGEKFSVDRPHELHETQSVTIDMPLPREAFSGNRITIAVLDSTGRKWKPSSESLRRVQAQIGSVTIEDLEKLFAERHSRGSQTMRYEE